MSFKSKFKNYAIFTGVVLGAMHVVNRVVYHISTIDNLLYNKDELYYESKFGQVYYTKQGSGTPLLLIHDLNVCSSSYEWNRVIRELSKKNTVYTIDLLGCGCSDKPYLTYTNYLYVQLIEEFIENVVSEKTNIIATGHSSSIALMACNNDSSYINKVILVNPDNLASLTKVPTSNLKIYKYLLYTPIIGTFIFNILVNKNTIRRDFKTDYFYDQTKIKERDIVTYFEASHKNNTHTKYLYSNIKSGYTNANVLNSLNKIDNSIYIIIGSSNPENELNASQYQNLLPSIEILSIDHTKYLPQLEAPDKFVETVSVIIEEI